MRISLKERLLSLVIVITMLFSSISVSFAEQLDIQAITSDGAVSDKTQDTFNPMVGEKDYEIWKASLAPKVQLRAMMSMAALSNGKVYNDFIEFMVGSDGRYTVGTTGGNPGNPYDNYQNMLYGHPSPWSSFTTIKVDGSNHYYNPTNQSPASDGSNLSNTSVQQIGDITVKQVLSIVRSNSTQREDTVQIKYIVTNNGTSSHSVGSRIMTDTMLGSNDAAPFRVPGIGSVTKGLELTGSSIPEYWQAFNSLTNPSVIAQGTLLRTLNKPDKVQFTNWGRIYGTLWDHTVSPYSENGDSAVGIYWNPKELASGETREYVTYYGLSEFIQDLRPPLAVSLSKTDNIEATDEGYVPNPITITGFIFNNGSAAANNTKIKIQLPESFIVDGEPELNFGDMTPGAERNFSFKVVVPEMNQATNVNYSIIATADNAETKNLTGTIYVPASKAESEYIKYYNNANTL